MGKIHVLMTKEEIDAEKMAGKIAVVLDVLSATSTIAAALADGAREVIPVIDRDHAFEKVGNLPKDTYVLAGESGGKAIDGFHYPDAIELRDKLPGKTLILSTTNGTVAIHGASPAKKVYVGSLLNGESVGQRVADNFREETVILVCSGSAGRFNIEDFYGAGYVIDCLLGENESQWAITDAARAALYLFRKYRNHGEDILMASRVGTKLAQFGFEEKVKLAAKQGVLPVIPIVHKEKIIREEEINNETV
ncbi:MAG TPA: 2-phosphosulfolactate phosphatase [Bacillales bacterium]|nr:2-phosphosulfolactate phosphatase [Bacillales bacterium]